MILALNVSAFLFLLLVGLALVIASWNTKDRLFYIRLAVIFIPIIAQVRQILTASGYLYHYPLFVFVVYFLLRCIGPLLNWHTHLQVNKPIKYFSLLNVATYLLLGYVLIDFFQAAILPTDQRAAYAADTFENPTLFSFSYPIIQLLHVGQAVYLIYKSKKSIDPSNSLYFMRIILFSAILLLAGLQVCYFFLDRRSVELIVAPILFIILYSIALFVSIKYSSVHNSNIGMLSPNHNRVITLLSERENQVLHLIAQGKTDKEISEEIHLSTNTVRTYITRIYTKLKLKNRTEAANFYNKAS